MIPSRHSKQFFNPHWVSQYSLSLSLSLSVSLSVSLCLSLSVSQDGHHHHLHSFFICAGVKVPDEVVEKMGKVFRQGYGFPNASF